MLILESKSIKKYYGHRLILDIDDLKVYSNDRIGLVGRNGIGKTTLLDILSQRIKADEGWIKIHGKYEYVSQLGQPNKKYLSEEMASKFRTKALWDDTMSGGEKTRFKLAQALSNESLMLFADEPTSNLDIEGIELLEEILSQYDGAFIIISHDRDFLDKLCNKIIELEDGKIKTYNGNYSKYKEQKELEKERAYFEYKQYVDEKGRLERAIIETSQKNASIKGPPKRMGISEARLHKMGGQKAKATLDRKVKNIKKRIEQLEKKEKPFEYKEVKFDILESSKLHSKIVIEGKHINKSFGQKTIFKDGDFTIYNGKKVALIGPNGCGKSTLLKMIVNGDKAIKTAKAAKIGYFSQDLSILNDNLTILENVMETSAYPEEFCRLLLGRLLFRGDSVHKKVGILSGGERVKVSFAKIILQDINLLILDEPTNYLDIDSLEAVESTLKDYHNTILLVSHDRRFISSIADTIMTIDNHKIHIFNGNYQEFLNKNKKKDQKQNIREEIILLETKLSGIIGCLSMETDEEIKERLDREYFEILSKIKAYKEML